MTSHYIDVLGGQIHYVRRGAANAARGTFICLHGNSSSANAFQTITESVAEDMDVISLDFPGHGRSAGVERFKAFYSFDGLRDVLLAFIDALELAPKGLIGHSLGGHVAIRAAAAIPSLTHLALISSPPIAGPAAASLFFRKDAPLDPIFKLALTPLEIEELSVAFSSRQSSPPVLRALACDIAQTDGNFREELGRSLQNVKAADEAALLKSLRESGVKVQLIGGNADAFIDPAYYGVIKSKVDLTDAESHLLPNVGHYPHLEAPELTAMTINAWLAQGASE